MDIGKNIRIIRKQQKLTLKELGSKVGLSEQAIGQYERGERKPNIDILTKIATALNVSVSILFKNDTIINKSDEFKSTESKNEILKNFYKIVGIENNPTYGNIISKIPTHTTDFKHELCAYIKFNYESNFDIFSKEDELTDSEVHYLYKKSIEYIDLLTERMKNEKQISKMTNSINKLKEGE